MELLSRARRFAVPALLAVLVVSGVRAAFSQSSELDERHRALVDELREAPDEQLGELLQRAFGTFMEDTRAMNNDAAFALARAMHERAQATWSAMSFALLSSRLGRSELADRILAEQIARTAPGPDRRLSSSAVRSQRWGPAWKSARSTCSATLSSRAARTPSRSSAARPSGAATSTGRAGCSLRCFRRQGPDERRTTTNESPPGLFGAGGLPCWGPEPTL